ncbi:MAG: RNA 2',3'-cyclic phosphodiesterase [Gammaproteobacteria bacterium]|nr:MAG: RNA 2',3'-cyclic phosphodiesterase [Gammaproteobacteria bacterium]
MNRHRLFFALYPDAEARQALYENVKDSLPEKQGRFVPVENLHMTLVFVGSCNDSDLECLQSCLPEDLSFSRFRIHLDHLGYWKRPKILWAGCSEVPDTLSKLVETLRDQIRNRCNLPIESRDYQPHVTLMRKVMPEKGNILKKTPIESVYWSITDIHLMESVSGPEGVQYRSIYRHRLA